LKGRGRGKWGWLIAKKRAFDRVSQKEGYALCGKREEKGYTRVVCCVKGGGVADWKNVWARLGEGSHRGHHKNQRRWGGAGVKGLQRKKTERGKRKRGISCGNQKGYALAQRVHVPNLRRKVKNWAASGNMDKGL